MSNTANPSGPVREVTCPGCYRQTDRIQKRQLPMFIFALVFYAWTDEEVVGCTACVRRRLWRRLGTSVFASNVAYPLIAPLILFQLGHTYRDDVPGIAEEYRGWVNLSPPPETEDNAGRRVVVQVVALGVLFVLGVVAYFIVS